VLHVALLLTYASVAVAVAVALPRHTALSAETAFAVGASLLIAAALAHEVWTRRRREEAVMLEVRALRGVQESVIKELALARTGVRLIRDALATGGGSGNRLEEMASEVQVLQKLVEQLWVRQHVGDENRLAASQDGRPGLAPPRPPVAARLDEAAVLDVVRDGLSAGRIDVYLQPIVGLPQRRRRFYECFSRIRDTAGALVLPEQYLVPAAREGLVSVIDNMLLFRCVQLIRKARRKHTDVGFFCNISRHSLADRDFLRDFADFLVENAELAPSLVLEMGQDDIDFDDAELMRYLKQLADLGIRFSLDRVRDLRIDCARLAERQFRFVKVEAALLRAAPAQGAAGRMPRMLRRELSRCGMELIVEKIESEQELVELLDYDIDFGQGYLFGEPRLGAED